MKEWLNKYKGTLVFIAVFWLILWLLNSDFVNPRDETDTPDERSGMALYIDHGTGCQYVKAGIFGGLTPRLGRDGKQICR